MTTLKTILLSAAVVTVSLAVLEGALRVAHYGPHRRPFILFTGNPERGLAERGENYDGTKNVVFTSDDATFWKFKPASDLRLNPYHATIPDFWSRYRVNEHGFRGAPFDAEKPEDVYRILALGDSITFGLGVPEEAMYTSVLAERLRDAFPGRRVEALSLGVPGYTSHQGRELLVREAMGYDPDLIILYFGGNNEFAASFYTDREYAATTQRNFAERLAERSAAAAFVADTTRGIRLLAARGAGAGSHGKTVRVPMSNFTDDLAAAARAAEDAGAAVVFVVPPHAEKNLAVQPAAEDYTDAVRALGGRFATADVDRRFREIGDTDALFLEDSVHPNKAGHRLIAETIAEAIVRALGTESDR